MFLTYFLFRLTASTFQSFNDFPKVHTITIQQTQFQNGLTTSLKLPNSFSSTLKKVQFFKNDKGIELLSSSNAIEVNDASQEIMNCQFIECLGVDRSSWGGAIYIHSNSNVKMSQCLIRSCFQYNGGAFSVSDSYLFCKSTNLTQNAATVNGAGLIFMSEAHFSTVISLSNSADLSVGCFAVYSSNGSIKNSAFLSNEADSLVGGIYLENSLFPIDKVYFIQNHANLYLGASDHIIDSAGAIYITQTIQTIYVTNCFFIQDDLFEHTPWYIVLIGEANVIFENDVFDIDPSKSIILQNETSYIPTCIKKNCTVEIDPPNIYQDLIKPEGGLKRFKMNFMHVHSLWYSGLVIFATISFLIFFTFYTFMFSKGVNPHNLELTNKSKEQEIEPE